MDERRRKGTYVAVTFSEATLDALVGYMAENDIPQPTTKADLHTTVLYSRRHVEWPALTPLDIVVAPERANYRLALFPQENDNCLVLLYDCPYLTERFEDGMANGGTHDYEDYHPHITLSYSAKSDFPYQGLPKPTFDIVIVEEASREIDLDWEPS
jgi:hypothetical protein